jgi:hypothetical protein
VITTELPPAGKPQMAADLESLEVKTALEYFAGPQRLI